eukprot:m.129276 g.129276  ORF g.129276 m.129276 type:complete len:793 (+) comp13889_c0_seq4:80-2458(+)
MVLKLTVYINGDTATKPISVVVPSTAISFMTLMDRITQRISAPFGAVRRLYTESGHRLTDVAQIKSGDVVVAAGSQAFKPAPYGARTSRSTAKMSPLASTRQLARTGKIPPATVISVLRNGEAAAPTRVPIPKSSKATLDAVIDIINSRLHLTTGPVKKLYTTQGKPVTEMADLQSQGVYIAMSARESFKPLSYSVWKASVGASDDDIRQAAAEKKRAHAKILTTKFEQLEQHIKRLLINKRQMDSLWRAIDYNGNNLVSLYEVEKLVCERFPLLNHKPALMRAYRQTTINDGDGDAYVERHEFKSLVRNMFYFNKLFHVFDEVDRDDDRRLTEDEFVAGTEVLNMTLTDAQARRVFKSMDLNGGGHVLFDEFCAWVAKNECPVDGEVADTYTLSSDPIERESAADVGPVAVSAEDADRDASIDVATFDALEKKVKLLMQDGAEMKRLWRNLDYNGNGICSLAEIDKFVSEQFPLLDNKPALMRAYKQTTLVDGDGDSWVERSEFPFLLRNIFYFNKAFKAFEGVDTDNDRRLTKAEFFAGLDNLGLALPKEEADAQFDFMDTNNGGVVLFDEFCKYLARKSVPVGSEVLSEFTIASKFTGRADSSVKKRGKQGKPSQQKRLAKTLARFAAAEASIVKTLTSSENLRKLWRVMDFNNNHIVSLAELDKWTVEQHPVLNHKPALMRAFMYTTKKQGDGSPFVDPPEFPALLRNILYFVKAFTVFSEIDQGQDRRINESEFIRGQSLLGFGMSDKEAASAFKAMDRNSGGQVLFDEFCEWVGEKSLPSASLSTL